MRMDARERRADTVRRFCSTTPCAIRKRAVLCAPFAMHREIPPTPEAIPIMSIARHAAKDRTTAQPMRAARRCARPRDEGCRTPD